jgi:hypothetical protein
VFITVNGSLVLFFQEEGLKRTLSPILNFILP